MRKKRRISKEARMFIANKVRKNILEGKPVKQSIAIAYSQAKQKGFKIKKPRRKKK
jgi:hypothetical protein